LALGMAGCISGTANIQPRAIARFIAGRKAADAACISTVRAALERYPLIAALKALLARDTGHADWAVTRPPITPLPADAAARMFEEVAASGYEPVRPPSL
jgi:4-hydroxy-tetrahydrodipicolinate synthase